MSNQLFGLVLVGGQSRRMGRDKALLSYDGKQTQLERTARQLRAVCRKVYISQRKEQAFAVPTGSEAIFDAVDDIKGPLCGILSAMHEHPEADWLVLACDLPNLKKETLTRLIDSFGAHEPTLTAYRNSSNGLPEPLCAIYPAASAKILRDLATQLDEHSPRKLLMASNAALVEQDDPHSLDNINTAEEFAAIRDK